MSRLFRSVVLLLMAALAFGGVAGQAAAQDEETGTVRVLNYYCSYLDSTRLVEAIDEAQCAPGSATFTFYLYGDGTDEHWTLTTDANGAGEISLAFGTYDVVAEETQTTFQMSVGAEPVQLLIGNPPGTTAPEPPAAETGTVTLQRYACSYLDTTLLAEAIEQEKCTPLAATFSFYLYGDGTDDFYAAYTGNDGQGSAELPVGTYDMVDELSQTHFDVNVLAGENVVLLVVGPQMMAPVPTEAPSPDTRAPTKLPRTGAGVTDGPEAGAVALAGTIALAAVGAAIIRRTREDVV